MRKPALCGALALSALMLGCPVLAQDSTQIRIGPGDIATVETLNFLIALERVKERGVDFERIRRRGAYLDCVEQIWHLLRRYLED
jgi:hypothetical protein